MNATFAVSAWLLSASSTPGSASPDGRKASTPARSSKALDAPMASSVLPWRNCRATKSTACAWRSSSLTPASPSGKNTASNSTGGEFSKLAVASTASPSAVSMKPSLGATITPTAPAACRAACAARNEAPSIPAAASNATLRVRMPPSPGKAISESAAETVTSGVLGVFSARGSAAGTGMPSPSATCAASCGDTLTSEASMRSRMAGTVSLLSSKRKPPAMCACSTAVWLA